MRSCLIDGEAVACDENGLAVFARLRRKPTGKHVFLYAFDLLELNGQDAFGLRLGSKVSKVASLVARPQGATMAEIIEATGDGVSKHNILRQLKGDGHPLRCEGKGKEKRFF